MNSDPYTAPDAGRLGARLPRTRRFSAFLTSIVGLCFGILAGVAWCVAAWGGPGRNPIRAAWLVGLIIAPTFAFSAYVRLVRTANGSGHLFAVSCAVFFTAVLSVPLRFYYATYFNWSAMSAASPWLFAFASGPIAHLPVCLLPSIVLLVFRRINLKQAVLLLMSMWPFAIIGFGAVDHLIARSIRDFDPNPFLLLFPGADPVLVTQHFVRVAVSGISVMILSVILSHAFDRPSKHSDSAEDDAEDTSSHHHQ